MFDSHSPEVCIQAIQPRHELRRHAAPRTLALCSALLALPSLLAAQTNVVTQHYDVSRTGANTNETILNTSNVHSSSFGRLFSQSVDGYVYAQPLYISGLTMGSGTPQAGTTHNVVFVATEHDSVYAFDADSNAGANASPLWHANLLDAAHGAPSGAIPMPATDINETDIVPEVGITGTPVIDTTTKTLYVVAKSTENSTHVMRLHAIDITTGTEKFGGPTEIAASVPGNGNGSSGGTLTFDTTWELQRTGLLLLNGIVYFGFGAHEDMGPWHGWILAYNAATLRRTGAWCTTPNGTSAGIWLGGSGLAATPPTSSHPYGQIFTATGNGSYNAAAPNYNNAMNYGDSIIKLDLANGVPTMIAGSTTMGDVFTPHDQNNLDINDKDVASGGVLILPDIDSGGQHLLAQVGKTGRIYIVNRDNLGGYHPSNTTDPEEKAYIKNNWGMPAYWNGHLYTWGTGDYLKAFSYINGVLSSTPTSVSSDSSNFPGSTPTVSANGTTSGTGIVWDIRSDDFGTQGGHEILYAHDAENVATLLYSDGQDFTRDNPGGAVKFVVPTVVNGKVYVGAQYQISVYGLLNGQSQAPMPVISPASESYVSSLRVTITDSMSGAKIYYTTNGTTPNQASTLYTGPFTVTGNVTVHAIAVATGYLDSLVASTNYTISTQAAMPTFSPAPGSYSSAQSVAITTTTSGATIYYTLDGSTPTTSSLKYTGPVSITTSATLSAMATAPNLSNSSVSKGSYVIGSGGGGSINFGAGFTSGSMALVGKSAYSGSRLRLTNGIGGEASAAWFPTPVNIQSFTTDFQFQQAPGTNPTADGMTFAIQGRSTSALGPTGGGLGYGAGSPNGTGGIPNSVAVKFDLYSNAGEGSNSTGLYTNGASPTIPATTLGGGVNLHSADIFQVHVNYDGTTLTMTITDTANTADSFTTSWSVNIPDNVGGNTAFVGFTAGTGGKTAVQDVLDWTYSSGSGGTPPAVATPVISPGSGTYGSAQTASIGDSTSGSTIYYTLDGSQPTTSSAQYTGSFTISSTTTVSAIAAAPNFSTSATARSTIAISSASPAATPVISPGSGTYSSAQTVSITDSTSSSTIYYTLDGSQPSTSSPRYTAPFSVSSSATVNAIATAPNFTTSATATSVITISGGSGGGAINFGSGFTAAGLQFNGHTTLNGSRLQLTDNATSYEVASAFFDTPMSVTSFTNDFTFQLTNANGDGFTFTIQNAGPTAIGPSGGGLGYGPGSTTGKPGIPNSVAVKFDLYSNAGEGNNSTGLYTDGASPTVPAITLGNGVNLHSGDIMHVHMTYDGITLTMTITDTANTAESFTTSWTINIPGTVGANTALVGFTAGTGGKTATQEILTWTYGN